jgi:DNA-binding NtrC family response regulator
MRRPTILVAESGEGGTLAESLRRHGFEVIEATSTAGVLRSFQSGQPDLVILGSLLERSSDGLDVARQIRRWDRRIPLILIAAESSEALAIAALRTGITDYFAQPLSLDELHASITRCLRDVWPEESSPDPAMREASLATDRMIGGCPAMRAIRTYLGKVALTNSPVLLTGDTGTGKELAAALIRLNSPRRHKPFVCINCAAIPEGLLESELFGHERGAFTGAHALQEGQLKLADGGTAFFDEIGDMSPSAQAKVLRVIETKEVHRLGGKGRIPLDVRIIAATNQDLERLVSEGKFRKDLYFRLNVVKIHMPSLQDRKEDIPLLAEHYVQESNRRLGLAVEGFGDDALEALLRYPWPGNVRELKNLIEAIFVDPPAGRISFADLPTDFRRRLGETAGLPQDERERLRSALFSTNWNKSRAAQKLHWSRMTLYRKIAKYQITPMRQGVADTGVVRKSAS